MLEPSRRRELIRGRESTQKKKLDDIMILETMNQDDSEKKLEQSMSLQPILNNNMDDIMNSTLFNPMKKMSKTSVADVSTMKS